MSFTASPVTLRPPRRHGWWTPGPIGTLAGALLIAALWLLLLPGTAPWGDRLGEMLGVEALWLMSCSMAAITTRQGPSRRFSGVSAQLWWHRVAGSIGLLLGIIHPRVMTTHGDFALTVATMSLLEKAAVVLVLWAFLAPTTRAGQWRGPLGWLARRNYDTWRIFHGVLALYVAFATYHGFDNGRFTRDSIALSTVYLAICAFAAWVVLDRMVAQRFRNRTAGATVTSLWSRAGELLLLVRPDRDAGYRPGDVIYVGSRISRERPIPLTIADTSGSELEFVVTATGKGTRRIVEGSRVGDRLSLSAPQHQAQSLPPRAHNMWVAGGSGIAPILASLRTMPDPAGAVALLWSRRGPAPEPLRETLDKLTTEHPWLSVRVIDTLNEPRLTGAAIVAAAGVPAETVNVRVCGPTGMAADLLRQLREAGVAHANIEIESFAFR